MQSESTRIVVQPASRHSIFCYIGARVLFWGFCRHNFAENGPQYLKMVSKDASRNSTQSMIKISS
jgi:hypothetical protein